MEAALEAFNQELRAQEEPLIEIGIGIDAGEVVAGNVGARDPLEYAVIGHPVNRSSRVEQLNKTFETRILMTERTRRHARLSIGRSLPAVTVKGIDEPLQVLAVGRKA